MVHIANKALRIVCAGVLGTVMFELFEQGIGPLFGLPALSAIPLANATIAALTGAESLPGAVVLHFAIGLIGYPFGWVLVARPLWKSVMPAFPRALAALAYGLVLWFFAVYVITYSIAGLPAFMGFSSIVWVALAGHIIYAVVMTLFLEGRGFSMQRSA